MLSSAILVCKASASASECTATVRMPSSLQARIMRRAISPRLAIRILRNMVSPFYLAAFYLEERLTEFNRSSIILEDLNDLALKFRFDLVKKLHGFHKTDSLAGLYDRTHISKSISLRAWFTIEAANDRRIDRFVLIINDRFRSDGSSRRGSDRRWRSRSNSAHRTSKLDIFFVRATLDQDFLFCIFNLKFSDISVGNYFDQRPQIFNLHRYASLKFTDIFNKPSAEC